MTAVTVVLIFVLAIIVITVIWAIATYNGFVPLRNRVQEAWRQIEVELYRRHGLIPNLIETVKGYAAQAQQENALSQALGHLFAVAENYPVLRASEKFQQLQTELTNTEDRIAAGRRFYNANVRSLNTKVESFPANLIASSFGFKRAEYFETEDTAVRAVPNVNFGGPTD